MSVLTRTLLVTAAGCVLLAAAFVVVAGVVGGAADAKAAAAGAGVAVAVLLAGSLTVNLVARVMPGMSLLVALMTYALQLLVLFVAFTGFAGSEAFTSGDQKGWLAGAVVLVTLAWTVVHLRLATKARIPVFEERPRNES